MIRRARRAAVRIYQRLTRRMRLRAIELSMRRSREELAHLHDLRNYLVQMEKHQVAAQISLSIRRQQIEREA